MQDSVRWELAQMVVIGGGLSLADEKVGGNGGKIHMEMVSHTIQ